MYFTMIKIFEKKIEKITFAAVRSNCYKTVNTKKENQKEAAA